jgi:hypothetical protein
MLSSPVYAKLHPRRPPASHTRAFSNSFSFSPTSNDSTDQLPNNIQTPSKARHHKALLHRQHRAPLSPLPATLTDHPVSAANKRLTATLTPLDATLTKNRGEGQGPPFEPFNLQTFQPANGSVPNSLPHTFLANPQQLTPYLSHSYKNHRGAPPLFSFAPCSLLALRVFHNSFVINRFHTLPKNYRGVRHKLLRPSVLVHQLSQPLRLAHAHPAILRLPRVAGVFRPRFCIDLGSRSGRTGHLWAELQRVPRQIVILQC